MRPVAALSTLVLTSTLLIPLSGCALPALTKEQPGSRFQPSPQAEISLFDAGAPRWGLALSGGGLRSALFSAGVMKAMYDAGVLDSIQVISTASGGGYNAYWLYSREFDRAGSRFGDATFQDETFKIALCELQLAGNFVPPRSIIATGLTLPFGGGFRQLYEARIRRTFGRADAERVQVHELMSRTTGNRGREGMLPYLIMNMTVLEPEPVSGWSDGLYEVTPLHHGNNSRGYSPWQSASIPMFKAVAISGAARMPLRQRVRFDDGTSVVIADGGASENLAAVALVRRRVENIIIIDGEQDANYDFGGYHNLQSRLASWGYALRVETIESRMPSDGADGSDYHMPHAVHRGTVTSTNPGDDYQGQVLYVKLTVPRSLQPVLENAESIQRGDELWETVFSTLEASQTAGSRNWNCESLSAVQGSYGDFFAAVVHHYNGFNPMKARHRYSHSDFALDFPHLSTVLLQSMKLDVSSALIGIGYLIGHQELGAAVEGLDAGARPGQK